MPRLASVGIVINPTAGHGRGGRVGRRVTDELVAAGHDVVDLSGESVADALARARGAALDGLRALVVVGGDGMVHLGVNAVVGTSTPLAIVAAGSGNDFAHVLGLPAHDARRAVARITAALDVPPRAVDAVHVAPYVAGAHSGADVTWGGQWYAGALSVGLDAAINAQANTYRWPPGPAKYVRAVLACVRTFTPYGYRITTEHDGKVTVTETLGALVTVANAPRFGGGVRIAPDATVDDGLLDVVVAQDLSRRDILAVFPSMYAGRHTTHPAVTITHATSVIIEPTGQGAFPPVAFADGEVVGPVPLRVEIHPGALLVLA